MPIYEYRCNRCGERFEGLQRSSGDAPPSCPACGNRDVSRLISIIAGLGSGEKRGGGVTAPVGCGCGGGCACGN